MKAGQSLNTFEEFAARFGLDIRFSKDQHLEFKEDIPVVLSSSQLDEIVDQISGQKDLGVFLEETAPDISPVCMSLFVLNEAIWELMKRKPWDKEKMLAMTTMPYCCWDSKEKSASNPKSAKRWELHPNSLAYRSASSEIMIAGEGGDFGGFIEQSMVSARRFGIPESWGLVPNYQFMRVEIVADLKDAKISVNPEPADEFDYDFSAPAKNFYDHGVHMEISGENVSLKVEKRKPSKLRGEVHLLIGVPSDSEDEGSKALLSDVWFWALKRLVEAEK